MSGIVVCCSANLNGASIPKLKELLRQSLHKFSRYPSIILIQEVKSLVAPELPGYLSFSSLSSAVGGCAIYSKATFSAKLLHAEHNHVLIQIKCGSSRVIRFGCSYNQFSKKGLWRAHFENIMCEIYKSNSALAWGLDFNFGPRDDETKEFIFAALQGKASTVERHDFPTCRRSSSPDLVIGQHIIANTCNLGYCRGTDHETQAFSFNPEVIPTENLTQNFYVTKLDDDGIDGLWGDLDLEKLDRNSPNANTFFILLELELRRLLISKGLIRKCPSLKTSIDKFVVQDAKELINNSPNKAQKLKRISNLINPHGSAFSFEDIRSALDKAENLPVQQQLLSCRKRTSKSSEPLEFGLEETWSLIRGIDSKKSAGPSVLSATILKRIPMQKLLCIIRWFTFMSVYGYPDFLRNHKCFGVAKSDGGVRPICVISILGKLYDLLLLNRLNPLLTPRLPHNQTAYLPGRRGCEEHLYTLLVASDLHKDLIVVLCDFKKCFNTIPNSVIENALISCGVEGTLLETTMDSLVSFRICDYSGSESEEFFRGVKQGGCSSGLIFCTVIISLSSELNNLPLERPVFISSLLVCHLKFADDVALLARCTADARLLSLCVSSWARRNGMLLNEDKCFILGAPEENLWYKCKSSAKYLGCDLKYANGRFSVSRRSTNLYFAYKLRGITSLIDDTETLKNLMRSFHAGMYSYPLCLSETLGNATSIGALVKETTKYDRHWKVIVRSFFGLSHTDILSVPRITSELGLTKSRFGCALVKYSCDFVRYLSGLSENSIAKVAFEAGTQTTARLNNSFQLEDKIETWPVIPSIGHWLLIPKKERRFVAKILLTIRASSNLELKSKILTFAANKEYKKLRDLVREILDNE